LILGVERAEFDGRFNIKHRDFFCRYLGKKGIGLMNSNCHHDLNRLIGEFEKMCRMQPMVLRTAFRRRYNSNTSDIESRSCFHEPVDEGFSLVLSVLYGYKSELETIHGIWITCRLSKDADTIPSEIMARDPNK
jgi:hypothetical protein